MFHWIQNLFFLFNARSIMSCNFITFFLRQSYDDFSNRFWVHVLYRFKSSTYFEIEILVRHFGRRDIKIPCPFELCIESYTASSGNYGFFSVVRRRADSIAHRGKRERRTKPIGSDATRSATQSASRLLRGVHLSYFNLNATNIILMDPSF